MAFTGFGDWFGSECRFLPINLNLSKRFEISRETKLLCCLLAEASLILPLLLLLDNEDFVIFGTGSKKIYFLFLNDNDFGYTNFFENE